MKKLLQAILIVGSTGFLMGCYSMSSPKAVVASVGESVRKGDYKNYQTFFTAGGYTRYANAKTFNALRKIMSEQKGEPSLSSQLLYESGNPWYQGLTSVYRVNIFLSGKYQGMAGVECLTTKNERRERTCSRRGRDGDRVCRTRWVTDTRRTCRVDTLKI